MKSKQNDAELIAEAYTNVEPLEVQEEIFGALASGAGAVARGAGSAARGVGKALVSEPAKKIYKGVGKGVKKGVEIAGGAALGAVGGAAEGAAKMVGGAIEGTVGAVGGAVQGAVDGATGGIGKAAKGAVGGAEDGEHEGEDAPMRNVTKRKLSSEEIQAKLGHEPTEDAEQRQVHSFHTETDSCEACSDPDCQGCDTEDNEHKDGAEHDAPEEVDMSQNPDPESLEVSKEVEEPAALAIVAPSIQPSIEGERVNHEDKSEMEMAKAELYKLEKYSFKLGQMLDQLPALEGWTASKITKAADYLSSVYHKLDYDLNGDDDGIHSEDHEGH